jgi:hypothetical protein
LKTVQELPIFQHIWIVSSNYHSCKFNSISGCKISILLVDFVWIQPQTTSNNEHML